MTRMSESESIIMKIIWQSQTPMSPGDVLNSLPDDYQWKYKTVATFLTRLTDKGLLNCKKQGNTNIYSPALSENDYIGIETKRFLEQYHQGSIGSMIAALYKDNVNKEKVDELLALIEKEL